MATTMVFTRMLCITPTRYICFSTFFSSSSSRTSCCLSSHPNVMLPVAVVHARLLLLVRCCCFECLHHLLLCVHLSLCWPGINLPLPPLRPLYQGVRRSVWDFETSRERVGNWGGPKTFWALLCVAERRATRRNGEWRHSTRRHMLEPERAEAV